jgi:hypothetical protein
LVKILGEDLFYEDKNLGRTGFYPNAHPAGRDQGEDHFGFTGD